MTAPSLRGIKKESVQHNGALKGTSGSRGWFSETVGPWGGNHVLLAADHVWRRGEKKKLVKRCLKSYTTRCVDVLQHAFATS